ncbi:GSCOCG00012151001-RA-CDS, partial [Cotesia congregata]
IKSRLNDYKKTLTFLVVPEISHFIPDQPIQRELIKIPDNIVLADPNFHKPAPVDLLLGAGTTLSLLFVGQIKLSSSNQQELYLQKTMFGWIIGGAAPS